MLELCDIYKTFNRGTVNEQALFTGFSFKANKGDFVSVVGSNGSGKTTMLNVISGSIPIDGGRVTLAGQDITNLPEYKRAAKIGRVFQDPSVGTIPGMTILENMSIAQNKGRPYNLGFAVSKKKYDGFRETVRELDLGLEDKMEIPVGLLSGGQRQAIALLMATMTPISFLILDEHTAALDPKTAEIIMRITDRIVKEKKLTAIMVTHNLRYAVAYGNRMLMLNHGNIVLEKNGDEKSATSVDELLSVFNSISIECGN
ncbi:MAG: ATP-binding cassette domain-containing protein [Oscillospiraceae bacterium]|jgi:putative ABC transport system ATP-binding protein|nr:ATP-binding cassette domain-containing protein [Oscillospiraceae bacterium]